MSDLDAALRKMDTRKADVGFRLRVADRVFRRIHSPLSVASAAGLLKLEPESSGFDRFNYRVSRALIALIGELGFSEGHPVLNDIHQDERFPQSIKELALETAQRLPTDE